MFIRHLLPQLNNSDTLPARHEQSVMLTLGSLRSFAEDWT